jgi:predicted NAD/FAD-dependent oxidoreductase
MKPRRIAILATGALAVLGAGPATALAATQAHSHAAAITRSDRSPDVKGSLDRSRTDNGRLDSSSSPDHSGVGNDTSRG